MFDTNIEVDTRLWKEEKSKAIRMHFAPESSKADPDASFRCRKKLAAKLDHARHFILYVASSYGKVVQRPEDFPPEGKQYADTTPYVQAVSDIPFEDVSEPYEEYKFHIRILQGKRPSNTHSKLFQTKSV